MTEVVTFDLDSTIAHTLHRQWMVEEILAGRPGSPTWDDYSMACADDIPIPGTVALMRLLKAQGIPIFIITARSAAARDITQAWLAVHNIPYDSLLMRPAADRTPSGEFKVTMLRRMEAEGYQSVLHVEDFPEVAVYITEHTGIPHLLVNANYPTDMPNSYPVTGGV